MSQVSRLVVVLYGRRAGTISRRQGALAFSYEPGYCDDPTSTPLSLSMPLAARNFGNRTVRAFLSGLLPDSRAVLQRWYRRFGLRDGDVVGLVAAIGSDAPGGATFLSEEEWSRWAAGDQLGWFDPVDERALAARLRSLRQDGESWLGQDEHWSLAGAQSKFTLRAYQGGWAIPHGGEPSTHIVKPGIVHVPAHALTEHVTMRAASIVGLPVAQTQYLQFEDQGAVVVTRFDRPHRDGRVLRMHQEDLCQALSLDPSRKYEADGGPGARAVADLLRSAVGAAAVERFVRAIIVNHLLGAPDAHAKNYALLLAGPSVELAPLYDVASGLLAVRAGALRYPVGAMAIGGERRFGQVDGSSWGKLAASTGLREEQVRTWVAELAESVPAAIEEAVEEVPADLPDRRLLAVELLPRVAKSAQLTLARLGGGPRSAHATASASEAIAGAAVSSGI